MPRVEEWSGIGMSAVAALKGMQHPKVAMGIESKYHSTSEGRTTSKVAAGTCSAEKISRLINHHSAGKCSVSSSLERVKDIFTPTTL